jgi:predicted peptidase
VRDTIRSIKNNLYGSIIVRSLLSICIIISSLLIFGCGKQGAPTIQKDSLLRTSEVKKQKPLEGIDFINTDNRANARLEFYYYIPSEVMKNQHIEYPILVCIPGLSGRGEQFVTPIFKEFAEKEGFVIVAPSFVWDQENWSTQRSYQYPDVWSGNALIAITKKLINTKKLHSSKLYLYGVSAGAQFALRFALWRPDLCAASVAHASGGTVIPERRINVRFFVSVGKEDRERIDKAESFYVQSRKLGINVLYKQYEGGHMLPPQQIEDGLRFLKETRNDQRI